MKAIKLPKHEVKEKAIKLPKHKLKEKAIKTNLQKINYNIWNKNESK